MCGQGEEERGRGGEGFLFQAEPTRSEHIYTQPFIQHCILCLLTHRKKGHKQHGFCLLSVLFQIS
jgi:hypothetical protein